MEILNISGESCYTAAEAKKLKQAINNACDARVTLVRGYWVHYVHFKDGGVQVRYLGLETQESTSNFL